MKKFAILSLVLALAMSLSACRGADDKPTESTAAPTTTVAPTTTAPTTMPSIPTTMPSLAPNIPDPSVDTSMPDTTIIPGTDGNNSTDSTGSTNGTDGTTARGRSNNMRVR